MNTGGKYVDGSTAMIFNISDTVSLITLADFPIWRELEGSQLDNFNISFTFRKIIR